MNAKSHDVEGTENAHAESKFLAVLAALAVVFGLFYAISNRHAGYTSELIPVNLPAGQYVVIPGEQGKMLSDAMAEYSTRHPERKTHDAGFILKVDADGTAATYIRVRSRP